MLGSEDRSPPCSGLGLGPIRGYALMGPNPLRASRIVLCLVPGNRKKKGYYCNTSGHTGVLYVGACCTFLPPSGSNAPTFVCKCKQVQKSLQKNGPGIVTLLLLLDNVFIYKRLSESMQLRTSSNQTYLCYVPPVVRGN